MNPYTLAKRAGMSQTHVQNIIASSVQPNIQTITKLTRALDCTLPEFFNEDPDQFYLTEDEKQLLSLFRRLDVKQKPHIIQLVDSVLEANKEFAIKKPSE